MAEQMVLRKWYHSAWKRLFFIDCIGIGRPKNHDNNKSAAGLANKIDIYSSSSDSVDGANKNGKQGCTTTTTTPIGNKSSSAMSATTKRRRGAADKQLSQQQQITPSVGNGKKRQAKSSKPIVRSPSNRALVQSDPLFHLYLICVGLITLSILAIKWLIPGMPIYAHTVIGFAFLLAIIVTSIIYTQFKSRKVSTSPSAIRPTEPAS